MSKRVKVYYKDMPSNATDNVVLNVYSKKSALASTYTLLTTATSALYNDAAVLSGSNYILLGYGIFTLPDTFANNEVVLFELKNTGVSHCNNMVGVPYDYLPIEGIYTGCYEVYPVFDSWTLDS